VTYNLGSPNGLLEPCNIRDLTGWYARELAQIDNKEHRAVLRHVGNNLQHFVRWPASAVLMWHGCNRIAPKGSKQRIHKYPDRIRPLARAHQIALDNRPNGPAIAAYVLAGGQRPSRFGSRNSWSVHHVYQGKFPYLDRASTLHAAKECHHFTQSAGLVAVHPIADNICDEFPFFAWLLRAKSFIQFGYDPDGAFSPKQNKLGFASGYSCQILCRDAVTA